MSEADEKEQIRFVRVEVERELEQLLTMQLK